MSQFSAKESWSNTVVIARCAVISLNHKDMSAVSQTMRGSYSFIDAWYLFFVSLGCAPPPGTYDVKPGDVKGAASFHKAERFRTAPKRESRLCLTAIWVYISIWVRNEKLCFSVISTFFWKSWSAAVPLPSPSKEVPMSPVRRTMSVDGLVSDVIICLCFDHTWIIR